MIKIILIPQPAITLKVIGGLYSGVTTVELDNLAAETAATMTTRHPDYAILAARIAISNLHKETKKTFSEVMDDLHKMINEATSKSTPMISDYHHAIIMKHADRLNSAIIYDRDFSYNYFGFKVVFPQFSHSIYCTTTAEFKKAISLISNDIPEHFFFLLLDIRKILFVENQWKSSRETTAHVDESSCWYSW